MLEVEALTVTRNVANKQRAVIDDLRFKIAFGRTVAIVSDSRGVSAAIGQALQGLLPQKDDRLSGMIRIAGTGIRVSDEEQMELRRGGDIGFAARTVTKKSVGELLVETFLLENHVDKREARRQVIFLLESIGFEDGVSTFSSSFAELGTFDQRRVMLANAICNGPRVLIVDDALADIEPTDRLRLVALIERLRDSLDCAVIWLTQSLVESVMYADEVCVMHDSRIVESGSRTDIFLRPEMPYTVNLLANAPSLTATSHAGAAPAVAVASASGCSYSGVCGRRTLVDGKQCELSVPALTVTAIGHEVRCHLDAGMRIRFARQILGGES